MALQLVAALVRGSFRLGRLGLILSDLRKVPRPRHARMQQEFGRRKPNSALGELSSDSKSQI
jgi:hypothetical protein